MSFRHRNSLNCQDTAIRQPLLRGSLLRCLVRGLYMEIYHYLLLCLFEVCLKHSQVSSSPRLSILLICPSNKKPLAPPLKAVIR